MNVKKKKERVCKHRYSGGYILIREHYREHCVQPRTASVITN